MAAKRVIKEVDLISDSIRKAQYHLCLYELAYGQGYAISKESGSTGQRKLSESWYRDTLEQADKKYEGIIRQKTSRSEGRKYKMDENQPKDPQLSLLQ
jgi:hypothetical protein